MIELRALAALLSYPTQEMRVALPEIAGEAPVDAASVARRTEPPEALDREWPERPAFADVPLTAMSGRPTRP